MSADDVARTFYQTAYTLLRANAHGELAPLATGTWWPRGPLDVERHGQAIAELRKEIKALSRVLLLADQHFRHVTKRRGRPRQALTAGR
ncbi:hypothetical protein [Acidiferrobacter sp.]|uniref:hypothetical protein n=1 Tax=Acidiferrobacter sp. TaxID=1872107 RepID=UPI00260E42E8|nr:hypothetical protein [Acidiferrobacter sp.]